MSTNRTWRPIGYPGGSDNDPSTVLYIPGFLSGNEPQTVAIDLLKQIFPASCNVTSLAWEGPASDSKDPVEEVGIQSLDDSFLFSDDPTDTLSVAWKSFVAISDQITSDVISGPIRKIMDSFFLENPIFSPLQKVIPPLFNNLPNLLPSTFLARWDKAKRDTENVADALADKIEKATIREQKGLLLIGHSLGANIVVKTLSRLCAKGVKIHQAVLLGAAIDNDDPNIEQACGAVQLPINSTINPYDHALAMYALCNMGHSALGSTGYSGNNNQLREYHVGINQNAPNIEHSSSYYIQQWNQLRQK